MPEPAHSAQPLIARDVRPPCLATVESAVAGDRMGVTCRGEFDVGAEWLQPELHAALDRSATGVDLDLSEVGFCDCGGLNVLLGLRRAALDQGKTVAVRVCSPAVGRLLDLTGARELFVAEETRNAEEPEYADDPAPPDTEAVRALHDAKPARGRRRRAPPGGGPAASGDADPAYHRRGPRHRDGLLRTERRGRLDGARHRLPEHQHQGAPARPGPGGCRPRSRGSGGGTAADGGGCRQGASDPGPVRGHRGGEPGTEVQDASP